MVAIARLEVLDPTIEPIPAHVVLAPRPETLDGKTLGLLANGKPSAVELLEMVHEVLADRYEFKSVFARDKGNASRPCDTGLMKEMARECDIVITASGD